MITRSVSATAAEEKTGMTLDELAAFVQEALRSDVAGDTVLRVRVNFKGGIKKLETRQ